MIGGGESSNPIPESDNPPYPTLGGAKVATDHGEKTDRPLYLIEELHDMARECRRKDQFANLI